METPLSITGMGSVSAAGAGLAHTRSTFFGPDRTEPNSAVDPNEKQFFKLLLDETWPLRDRLSPMGLRPNLFALVAAQEALATAGLTSLDLKTKRVGVCLGSTVGGTNYREDFWQPYFRGELPPLGNPKDFFSRNSATFLSEHLGLHGPTLLLNNACTSGADAIGTAADWLRADLCDIVLCGGTEVVLQKIFYGFRSLMLCSQTPCKPFDRARTGLTLGEGAGILVLEKSNSPRKPKAHLLGYGTASDSYHPTAPHPEARGLDQAVRSALTHAGRSLQEVDFINAHATATPHNDLAEGRWIRANAPNARTVATKGYTGHTLGAAGGLEAVFTALSLIDGKLPRSRGFHEADPEVGLTPTTGIETGSYKTALSLSLGFGGTNSVLCLGGAT